MNLELKISMIVIGCLFLFGSGLSFVVGYLIGRYTNINLEDL